MTAPQATSARTDARASGIRWAAVAAILAGVLMGGALFLRPLLDIQFDTPESTALAIASSLGRILFILGLVGVHLVYGHRYGLLGQIVIWTLVVVSVVTLLNLLFTFGVVEPGSPLDPIVNIGTALSFLLVSLLGIALWLAGANRWAAGLLIVLFPLGIVFGMLQAVPALAPLTGVVAGLAFIALGVDLWPKARLPSATG